MSQTHATVRIDTNLVEDARRESAVFNRSLGGQIEHWARLGRALENAAVSHDRVRQVLTGQMPIDGLSEAEEELVYDALPRAFTNPSEELRAHYRMIGERTREALARAEPHTRPADAPKRDAA